MQDSAVLVADLHIGNIDLAERVRANDVPEISKYPQLRIVTAPSRW
jgi:hypothetical protein